MNQVAFALGTSDGDLLVFALAPAATLVRLAYADDVAAYAFPRLVSVPMLALSSVNLLRRTTRLLGPPLSTMAREDGRSRFPPYATATKA